MTTHNGSGTERTIGTPRVCRHMRNRRAWLPIARRVFIVLECKREVEMRCRVV